MHGYYFEVERVGVAELYGVGGRSRFGGCDGCRRGLYFGRRLWLDFDVYWHFHGVFYYYGVGLYW